MASSPAPEGVRAQAPSMDMALRVAPTTATWVPLTATPLRVRLPVTSLASAAMPVAALARTMKPLLVAPARTLASKVEGLLEVLPTT